MTSEEKVTASANIGFAIATTKASVKNGVSMEQIDEMLRRLEEALEIVSKYEK